MSLPGVSTVLLDQFYALSRTEAPRGPVVVAIAPRSVAGGSAITSGGFTVADLDPYLAINEKAVIDNFGLGSGCHRAFFEAITAGANQIYLVAFPNGTSQNSMESISPTGLLAQAIQAASTVQPDIICAWGRGGSPTEWEVPATPGDEPSVGLYADNSTSTSSSMVKFFADQIETVASTSHPCLGVIGCYPYVNVANTSASMTAAQIATQVSLPNLCSNNDVNFGANGKYVAVILSEILPLGYNPAWGYANGAVTFGSAVSNLAASSAPTNKVLFNIAGLRYNPTQAQQTTLVGEAVIPVALDFNRIPRWVDGPSYAPVGSDYQRISTVRIVFDAINMVRQVGLQFIGEASTLQHRNALETAISSGLRNMQSVGELLASDYQVTYVPASNLATVDLVLTPAFEIRNIQVSVSLNLQ